MTTVLEPLNFQLTQKQAEAFRYLTNDDDESVLYGGAKGGGKSYLMCLWVFYYSTWLARFFDINEEIKHPLLVGFFGRKQSVDFTDTTLETWKKIIPIDRYEIRNHDKEIIIDNMVKVGFGGLDSQEAINKFNSMELVFFCVDQAEETLRKDVAVAQASLRLRFNNKTPPYKQLYTANPSECWLKEDFVLKCKPRTRFVPALPDDNPYLPTSYKQTLRDSFSYDPALLQAYLEGDWDAFSNLEDALCKAKHFVTCRNRDSEDNEEDCTRIISGDIATKHGSNFTAIMYRYGDTIKELNQYQGYPITKTAQVLKMEYERKKGNSLVVDSDGVGEGVSDILIGQNVYPLEFHGGYAHQAEEKKRFRNLRSQFAWVVSKKLEKGVYCFKYLPQAIYETLKSQSCSIKVKVPDGMGRFQIETKEDMMARGIKSPDLFDTLLMSEYALWRGSMADLYPSYKYR